MNNIDNTVCPVCGGDIPTAKLIAIETVIRQNVEAEYEARIKFLTLEFNEQLCILLSKYWLTHTNDQVAAQFGCNFVPNIQYQDKANEIRDIASLDLSIEQLNGINKSVIKDVMRNCLTYAI